MKRAKNSHVSVWTDREDSFNTYLVTVSLQVVQDIPTGFSHVLFAGVYHLLVNVHGVLRTNLRAALYTSLNPLRKEIWQYRLNAAVNQLKLTEHTQ